MFFFFKQKTADEMLISDMSSDWCSSDLAKREKVAQSSGWGPTRQPFSREAGEGGAKRRMRARAKRAAPALPRRRIKSKAARRCARAPSSALRAPSPACGRRAGGRTFLLWRNKNHREQAFCLPDPFRLPRRSEEHTSELQSLMRISYAVFCLKK